MAPVQATSVSVASPVSLAPLGCVATQLAVGASKLVGVVVEHSCMGTTSHSLARRLDTRLSMSTPQVSTDAHRAMGGKRHMYMLWELELLFPVVLVLVCSLDMT